MEGPGTINPNEFTQCEINQLLWLLELGEPPNSPPNTIGICFNIVRQPVTPFSLWQAIFPLECPLSWGLPPPSSPYQFWSMLKAVTLWSFLTVTRWPIKTGWWLTYPSEK